MQINFGQRLPVLVCGFFVELGETKCLVTHLVLVNATWFLMYKEGDSGKRLSRRLGVWLRECFVVPSVPMKCLLALEEEEIEDL